jgi:predicted transcriptional regulator
MTVSDDKSSGDGLISFRAEKELREALERIAEKNDRTLSAEIRRVLKRHVTAEAQAA